MYAKVVQNEILRVLQLDERRRRELLLWPIAEMDHEVTIPKRAICPFFAQSLRGGNMLCLHLLSQRGGGGGGGGGGDGLPDRDTTRSVQILLSSGASVDVNAKTDDGDTSLHLAAARNYLNIVKVLLRYGAHSRARNNIQSTPLLYGELFFFVLAHHISCKFFFFYFFFPPKNMYTATAVQSYI